jgi:hypothetical protein
MRAVFLLGGFVGFCLAAASALHAGRAGDRILLDGAVGCLAGALLFRWFWSTLVTALTHTVKVKRAERAAAEEAAAAEKPAPVKGR